MAVEIERKFLVVGEDWRELATSRIRFSQGYLSTLPGRSVRVRVADDNAWLTIKGATVGATRSEFEYAIPVEDGQDMLDNLCQRPLIEKWRYLIHIDGLTWEVDEFLGENQGLVVAELELESEGQTFQHPDWLGIEVTEDPRYFNASLSVTPYSSWEKR
nr:CYTH domain-containing protein [uncultured Desulfuromonas sp.]